MSDQQAVANQAAEEALQEQLANRETLIIQMQEELGQKDALLQQISMAAAPDLPSKAPTPKRNASTPVPPARVPRPTPPRFINRSQSRIMSADLVCYSSTAMTRRLLIFHVFTPPCFLCLVFALNLY